MIIRLFRKCSILVNSDGSEDDKINMIGLGDYSVESDDKANPFLEEEDEASEDLTA